MVTSTNKGLSEPAYNTPNWDTILNNNFDVIDKALGSSAPDISLTGLTTYAVSTSQTPYMSLKFTGTPTSDVAVTLPTGVGGQWVIRNNSTKAMTITSLAGGAGSVTIQAGSIRSIYCDGSNVYFADAQGVGSNTQVAYTSGGVLTGSDDFTFDGAVLSVGASTAVSTANTSGSGPYTATVTFSGTKVIPVGAAVVISGVTPTAYNGVWTVTSSSAGSVSFTVTSALTSGSGGTIAYGTFKAGGANVSMPYLNENRTAGVTSSTVDDGTITTGTYTPTPTGGNFRKIINNAGTVATTAASCVGTVATVTYSGAFSFMVGSTVTVSGVTPAGYNGTWVVTASSAGSVSFAVPATLTAGTVQGTVTNGFFLAAPTASNDYTLVVQVTNSATAGAINLSGFTKRTGDALTLTNASKFFIFITKCNGLTLAVVQALQ